MVSDAMLAVTVEVDEWWREVMIAVGGRGHCVCVCVCVCVRICKGPVGNGRAQCVLQDVATGRVVR